MMTMSAIDFVRLNYQIILQSHELLYSRRYVISRCNTIIIFTRVHNDTRPYCTALVRRGDFVCIHHNEPVAGIVFEQTVSVHIPRGVVLIVISNV